MLNVAYYHGGLTANERFRLQEQFLHNELDCLIATNAFGMGIDKPDIRYVLHYQLSSSLENYVQEIGRSGRDGLPALAVLFYQEGDERVHHYFRQTTYEMAEDIQFLQTKSKREIRGILPSMNDLQKKWLENYLNNDYSFDELTEKLKQKQNERYAQIHAMLDYARSDQCLRAYIHGYFLEEQPKERKEQCCTNCDMDWMSVLQTKTLVKPSKSESWQEIFQILFK